MEECPKGIERRRWILQLSSVLQKNLPWLKNLDKGFRTVQKLQRNIALQNGDDNAYKTANGLLEIYEEKRTEKKVKQAFKSISDAKYNKTDHFPLV